MITRTGTYAEPNAPAAGKLAHTDGWVTTASGLSSHAEGYQSVASGNFAHAEGYQSVASGTTAHAEGFICTASGNYSHAQGRYAVADKVGQCAQCGVQPSTLLASVVQYSTYTIGGSGASGTGNYLYMDGVGSATYTTAGINVLLIPLKSVALVRFDIVGRPNATAAAAVAGVCWSGTVLVGRGNSTGTAAAYSTGSQAHASAQVNVPALYTFDAAAANVTLTYYIDTTVAANNALQFYAQNNSGVAYSYTGVLQCTELVTTT